MSDPADRLISILEQLEELADELTPEEAVAKFDQSTLQLFWREWPQVNGWTGNLWRLLHKELAASTRQADEEEEIGGSE